jgi:hypothetical protein
MDCRIASQPPVRFWGFVIRVDVCNSQPVPSFNRFRAVCIGMFGGDVQVLHIRLSLRAVVVP